MTHRSSHNTSSGFILVEMIVSTALFSVAVLILVGALIVLTDGSRKARTQRAAIDNLSAAIEGMSRAIRVGSTYHCGDDTVVLYTVPKSCPFAGGGAGPSSVFAFEPTDGIPGIDADQWVYGLNMSGVNPGVIERSRDNGATWQAITALNPEMNISKLDFYVENSVPDLTQPRVTMVIRGESGIKTKTKTDFTIQTSITQRMPNFNLTP